MSNLARHVLGVPIGVILTVATWLGLGWATNIVTASFARYFGLKPTTEVLLAMLTILVLAVLLGLVTSARFMSPLAALIPGVVFLVLSVVQLALQGITGQALRRSLAFLFELGPNGTGSATAGLVFQGVYPLLGVLLIVSAIPPHRWRARPVEPIPYASYAPAGLPGTPPPPAPPATAAPTVADAPEPSDQER